MPTYAPNYIKQLEEDLERVHRAFVQAPSPRLAVAMKQIASKLQYERSLKPKELSFDPMPRREAPEGSSPCTRDLSIYMPGVPWGTLRCAGRPRANHYPLQYVCQTCGKEFNPEGTKQ
jgi:hypothetical protein